MSRTIAILLLIAGFLAGCTPSPISSPASRDYLRQVYSPLHFKPAINGAKDADCLACHKEVLEDKVRPLSPAGLNGQKARAWYQQTSTYQGEQDTFHRRHLVTPLAQQLMQLSCNSCHQGHDPREEAPGSSATAPAQTETGFTLRKQVNPEATCLKCHGQMNWTVMGLPSAWPESKQMFNNDCLTCHVAIRTKRHAVSYLKPEAIEAAAKGNGDVCFGCHGGRAWYRITYPYPRHSWEGMAPEVPDWAKNRPTESEVRFLIPKGADKK